MRGSWFVVSCGIGGAALLAGCERQVVVVESLAPIETSFDSLCERQCACVACDDEDARVCLERGAELDDDARDEGCTEALALYVECAEREHRCQAPEGAKATCEAELTAYYDCRSASASRR